MELNISAICMTFVKSLHLHIRFQSQEHPEGFLLQLNMPAGNGQELAPFKGYIESPTTPSPNYVDFLPLPFLIMSTVLLRSPKDEAFSSSHDVLVVLHLGFC